VRLAFFLPLLLAVALGAFTTAASGCTGDSGSPAAEKIEAERSTPASLARAKASCPVTTPNGRNPPGERPSRTHHGNGLLWTALWPKGVIVAGPKFIRPDGSIRMKFMWWADVGYLAGDLTIRGRRLDAPAPPLGAGVSRGSPETGFSGSDFWGSEIVFPTEGCWEVTGKVEHTRASLTFTTFVVKG
jgi:hypothetical protein